MAELIRFMMLTSAAAEPEVALPPVVLPLTPALPDWARALTLLLMAPLDWASTLRVLSVPALTVLVELGPVPELLAEAVVAGVLPSWPPPPVTAPGWSKMLPV